MIVDLMLTYNFISRLARPFSEWEACKLGIIDSEGKVLRKRASLTRPEEQRAFSVFDVMVLNIKKLLAKVPGGNTRIASFAAALYLMKEWQEFTGSSRLTEDVDDFDVQCSVYEDLPRYLEAVLSEEGPTNSVGAGGVAMIAEPIVRDNARKAYKKKNRFSELVKEKSK